jgi:hypothetical protein
VDNAEEVAMANEVEVAADNMSDLAIHPALVVVLLTEDSTAAPSAPTKQLRNRRTIKTRKGVAFHAHHLLSLPRGSASRPSVMEMDWTQKGEKKDKRTG